MNFICTVTAFQRNKTLFVILMTYIGALIGILVGMGIGLVCAGIPGVIIGAAVGAGIGSGIGHYTAGFFAKDEYDKLAKTATDIAERRGWPFSSLRTKRSNPEVRSYNIECYDVKTMTTRLF